MVARTKSKLDAVPQGYFRRSLWAGATKVLEAGEAEALRSRLGEAIVGLGDGRQIVISQTGVGFRYDRVIPIELRYRCVNAQTGESYCDAGPGAQPLWSQLTRGECLLFISESLATEVEA